ncbi:MAG: transglycosylase SLT domain-containing protein [Myxococcota bacterium]
MPVSAEESAVPEQPAERLRYAQNALKEKPLSVISALKDYRGPAADYADHLRAWAWWKLDKPEVANVIWDNIQPRTCKAAGRSPLATEISVTRARLVQAQDPKRAAEYLLALPPQGDRWIAAIAHLRAAGLETRANDIEIRLLTELPASSAAIDVAKTLGPPGVVDKLQTIDRRLARLKRLMRAHANTMAAEEGEALETALAPEDPRRCDVLFVRGKTARKRRRYDEAVALLQRARPACEGHNPRLARAVALLEVRVQAILGDPDTTKKAVQWLIDQHPSHRYTDDARFLLADLLQRRDRPSAARREYKAVTEMKGADHVPLARWRLAWRAIQRKRYREAKMELDAISAISGLRPQDYHRAEYWRGRISEHRRPQEAVERYKALATQPSFYGWLALSRLQQVDADAAEQVQRRLVSAATATTAVVFPARLKDVAAFADADVYGELGKTALAGWSFARLGCEDQDEATVLSIALALDRIGQYAAAQWILRRHPTLLKGPITAKTAPRWRIAYSRPFREPLRQAAQSEGIDELLLTALVREESTFDPSIVSWAGATGLAQLMPATAARAYAQVFGGRLDLQRLKDPQLNVRLGARVLQRGITAFGHPVLALGAYNGGHRLVRGQLPEKDQPFEQWIEDFGVKQTRRYMKRVSETWGIYRLLYSPEAPFIDLPISVQPQQG